MPRFCSICTHDAREEIDQALVRGESTAKIAGRYRTLDERALRRHRSNHLPATLARAHEAEEVANADDLLAQVRDLQARALTILDKAEEAGELITALRAIREARGNLELLGKLAGELQDGTTVNLYLSPEWLELRALIVAAVEPYPEARGSILRALERVSNGSGP
jgi:hypothetical protein